MLQVSAASMNSFMGGMPTTQAKKKFLEIWAKEHTEQFDAMFPGVWPWMETWYRLRAKNQTADAMAQAFLESLQKRTKANHRLSEIIHTQRLELNKRLNEIDRLKQEIAKGKQQ